MARSSYEWKSYCEERGLTKKTLEDIINLYESILEGANMVFVLLLVWFMFSGLLLNFFSCWPFFLAYAIDSSKGVYKESLYRKIRKGDHQCNVAVKKALNTFMGLMIVINLLITIYKTDKKF